MNIYPLILASISLDIFNSVIKTHISKYRKINSTYMLISSIMRLPISYINCKEFLFPCPIIGLISILVVSFEIIELKLMKDNKFLRISVGTNSRILFVAIGHVIFKKQKIDFYQIFSIFIIILSILANAFGAGDVGFDSRFLFLCILIGLMSATSSLLYDIKARSIYDIWSYKFAYDVYRLIFLSFYFSGELFVSEEQINVDRVVLLAAIISTIKSVIQYLIIYRISALTRVILAISIGVFSKQITSFILKEKFSHIEAVAFSLSVIGFLFYNHKDVTFFINMTRDIICG